jgi:putative addiction module component (TIGR02574 family)
MPSLGIDRLSAQDRLRLIEEIWDTLSDSPDELPVSESHK